MGRSRSPPTVDNLVATKPVFEVKKELSEMTQILKVSLIRIFDMHKSIVRGYQLVEEKRDREPGQASVPGPGSTCTEDVARIRSAESLCSTAPPDTAAFAALQKKVDDQEQRLIKLKEDIELLITTRPPPMPHSRDSLDGSWSTSRVQNETPDVSHDQRAGVVKDLLPHPARTSAPQQATPVRNPGRRRRKRTSGRPSVPCSMKPVDFAEESCSTSSSESASSSGHSSDVDERKRSESRSHDDGVRIRLDDPHQAQVDKEKLMKMIKEKIAIGCLDNIFQSGSKHTESSSDEGVQRKKRRRYRRRKGTPRHSPRSSVGTKRSRGNASGHFRKEKRGKES